MFGWDMHGWDWEMHMGPGWLWLILVIAFIVVFVALVLRATQARHTQDGPTQGPTPDASQEVDRILKTRLARGEISREEYEETRRTLGLR